MKRVFLCSALLAAVAAAGWSTGVIETAGGHNGEIHEGEALLAASSEVLAFPDIHGIGYTSDGLRLVVAAHDGPRVYERGSWAVTDGPPHDYMGFAPVSGGYFASGHPSLRTRMRNPLGLVWVSEDTRSVTSLAYAGRFDFHLLAAGYKAHTVYAAAQEADLPGMIHSSVDRGRTWKHGRGSGLRDVPLAMAAHPSAPGVLVVGTAAGLYLSHDYGDTFEPLAGGCAASAVTYSPDGETFLYACKDRLAVRSLRAGTESTVPAPPLSEGEIVTALAVNPADSSEIAAATSRKSLYVREGDRWRRIVAEGWAQ